MAIVEEYDFYHEQVKCPLFHVSYEVIVGKDMQSMARHLDDLHLVDQIGSIVGQNHIGYSLVLRDDMGALTYLVMIKLREPSKNEPSVESTIVHESLHLSWFILDGVGVKLSADNHETQAYLQEDLFDNIKRVVDIAKSQLKGGKKK